MTSSRHSQPEATPRAEQSPDVLLGIGNAFFEAQRVQWAAMLAWQQSLATFGKDLCEQWAVRYAGGMPFDG
ncbi:MAG TPA: hypothetical protein VLD35_10895 [Caldimonas sp.]|nr:hypothetical protein [Caldimonas sp.]